MASASPLLVPIDRARRRRQAVAFVRLAGVTVPLAVAGIDVALLLLRPAAPYGPIVAGVVSLAIAAAAVAAWLKRPTARETAVVLDRRLQLEDRLVTAMACLAQDDDVARLVVRDATTHIGNLDPARVFPIEAPRRFGWLVAAAAGSGLLLLATPDAPALWSINRPAGVSASSGAQSIKSSSRTSVVVRDRADQPSPGTPSAAPATAPPAAPGDQPSRPAVTRDEQGPRGTAPTPSPQPDTSSSTMRPPPRGPTAPGAMSAATRSTGSRSDAGRGSGARTGSSGRGSGGAGDAKKTSGPGGSGGTSDSAAGRSGGVNGGSLTPARVPSGPLAPVGSAAYAAAYRDAWSRAEAALSGQRVPAALREYVRKYFVAIKGDGGLFNRFPQLGDSGRKMVGGRPLSPNCGNLLKRPPSPSCASLWKRPPSP